MLNRSKIIKILIFLLSFLIITKFNIDPDLGWHVAIGDHFLKTGEILRTDKFSWTMAGYSWGNSYFVYQILVAYLLKNIGLLATGILFGTISGFAVLILVTPKPRFSDLFLVVLGAGMTIGNLGVRPHVFDFLLFSLLLVLLSKKMFRKGKFVAFWFIFFAIWANLHIGFLIGLAIFSGVVALDFLWRAGKSKKVSLAVAVFSIIGAFLGTLLTPFHFQIWKSVILESGGPAAWLAIAEFQPVIFFFPINIFFAATGIIFIYIFKHNRKVEPVWLLVGAFLFMLPFLFIYFVLFWGCFFIFISTRYFSFDFKWEKDLAGRTVVILCAAAAALALFLSFLVNSLESYRLDVRLKKDRYPLAAAAILKEKGLTAGLFNDYRWGGYLVWQHPELPVFIDGRMAGWRRRGRSILDDYILILGGNCKLADEYGIKLLLVEAETKTKCFDGWNVIYKDPTAKILGKPHTTN